MSEPYRIQFRGPWHAEIRTPDGDRRDTRLNIRHPADWNGWLHEDRFSGQLILHRQFNWTFPDPPPLSIAVVISGLVPQRLLLNDQELPTPGGRVDVTGRLQGRNRLSLVYELEHYSVQDSLLSGVFLESMDG